jgi:hypothetical protein
MNIREKASLYCCEALNYQKEDKYCPIEYSKKWREYSIRDFSSTSRSLMMFCPNCGTRLPSSLRDEWFDILEQEYGLEDPMDDDKKKIPKEFLTDEWWKKRKLTSNTKKGADQSLFLDRPERCLF